MKNKKSTMTISEFLYKPVEFLSSHFPNLTLLTFIM